MLALRNNSNEYIRENGALYSAATVSIVQNAIEIASRVLANANATQAEIDNAYNILRAAMDGLVELDIEDEEEELGVFTWPGFPGAFMPWRYPGNFWPWFFWGLGLL